MRKRHCYLLKFTLLLQHVHSELLQIFRRRLLIWMTGLSLMKPLQLLLKVLIFVICFKHSSLVKNAEQKNKVWNHITFDFKIHPRILIIYHGNAHPVNKNSWLVNIHHYDIYIYIYICITCVVRIIARALSNSIRKLRVLSWANSCERYFWIYFDGKVSQYVVEKKRNVQIFYMIVT